MYLFAENLQSFTCTFHENYPKNLQSSKVVCNQILGLLPVDGIAKFLTLKTSFFGHFKSIQVSIQFTKKIFRRLTIVVFLL